MRLERWTRKGWKYVPDGQKPAVWRPREWNKQADELANLGMGLRTRWTAWCSQPECRDWGGMHIRIYTDEGRRRRKEERGMEEQETEKEHYGVMKLKKN